MGMGNSSKIPVAVVGCGAIATGTHLPNLARHPDVRLKWCCDLNPAALQRAREMFSPERVTDDASAIAADPEVEAVLIATTHRARPRLVELFAGAGKALYLEKPVAETWDDLRFILQAIQRAAVPCTVGHNRRFAPAVLEARRIFHQHRANPAPVPWRWDRHPDQRPSFPEEDQSVLLLRVNDDYWSWKPWAFREGGILVGELTHFVDLAYYLVDRPPAQVFASGSSLANNTIQLTFEDGSLAVILEASVGCMGYPKELVEIYHQGAAIVIDHLVELRVSGVVGEPFRRTFPLLHDPYPEMPDASGIEGYYRKALALQQAAVAQGDNSLVTTLFPDKGHYALLSEWLKCVRAGGSVPSSVQEAAMATAVIIRAVESLKQGQPLAVSPADYSA